MKIRPVSAAVIRQAYGSEKTPGKTGFGEMLSKMISDTDTLQSKASSVVSAAVGGQPVEAHNVMLAAEEARLAFDLMLEVRNKIMEAYRELMQMRM
ncbi:MAG: flagellar hook-basal body complex protein FliE [Bacteroidales bacterium]|nr:flagellar hook-basal body complex protein FliE [Candidatus Latescibacterota bacterium]